MILSILLLLAWEDPQPTASSFMVQLARLFQRLLVFPVNLSSECLFQLKLLHCFHLSWGIMVGYESSLHL